MSRSTWTYKSRNFDAWPQTMQLMDELGSQHCLPRSQVGALAVGCYRLKPFPDDDIPTPTKIQTLYNTKLESSRLDRKHVTTILSPASDQWLNDILRERTIPSLSEGLRRIVGFELPHLIDLKHEHVASLINLVDMPHQYGHEDNPISNV